MQHTYGDAGDEARGVVFYHPREDRFQFVQNPEWDTFRVIRVTNEADLAQAEAQAKDLKGKYVNMLYTGEMSMNARKVDSVHNALLKAGAKEARKALATSFLSKSVPVAAPLPVQSPDAAIPSYVGMASRTLKTADPKWQNEVISLGQSIVQEVMKKDQKASFQRAGETFVAKLVSVSMENFLGVREPIELNVTDMKDGVWFLTGANGSGKVRNLSFFLLDITNFRD